METFVTQCPQCQTAFRINQAQLQAADGHVRCGACLHVFSARSNFISKDASGDFTARLDQGMEQPSPVMDEASQGGMSIEEVSWEEYASAVAGSQQAVEPEARYVFRKPASVAPAEPAVEDLPDLPDSLDSLDEDDPQHREPALFSGAAPALRADLDDEDSARRFSSANREALRGVSSPLELETRQRNQIQLGRIALSTVAAVLLIVLLGFQLLWFNRQALSLEPDWRPRIEAICSLLPCTVAPRRDLTAISSSNLVVRSHPEARGALLVSLNFRNEADFEQPFPALTLRFSDRQQNLVASRRFLPEEYLPEELRTMSFMPPNTTVQARVDIVDPGSEAINYEVFLGAID